MEKYLHIFQAVNIIIAGIGCFLLLTFSSGCNKQKEGEEAVAWVNGEPILFSVFWEEIKNRYNEMIDVSSPKKEILLVLKKTVCSDLIRERLLLQKAAERGIIISEEALTARINEIKKDYTASQFNKSLMIYSRDYGHWREELRNNMILETLFQTTVQEVGSPSDREVQKYYKSHLDEFLMPETVHLSQIVLKDQTLAKKVLRKLKKGNNFESLAQRYSLGPEKDQKGKLGAFQRGELPEPIEKEAFSTPKGKITSLVETPYGFHILRIDNKIPAHVVPLKSVKKKIVRKMLQEKQEVYYADWVDKLTRKADIRIHESLINLILDKATTLPQPKRGEK